MAEEPAGSALVHGALARVAAGHRRVAIRNAELSRHYSKFSTTNPKRFSPIVNLQKDRITSLSLASVSLRALGFHPQGVARIIPRTLAALARQLTSLHLGRGIDSCMDIARIVHGPLDIHMHRRP